MIDLIATTEKIFFHEVDVNKVYNQVNKALHGSDGGELFLEFNQSELLTFENGVLKHSDFGIRKGFGLRSFRDDVTSFVCSSTITEEEIEKAAALVSSINAREKNTKINLSNTDNRAVIYPNLNPIEEIPFNAKVKILQEVDSYLRAKNQYVKQVKASIMAQWQAVQIIKEDGFKISDIRPLVRFSVMVVVEREGRKEQGSSGNGGRDSYHSFISDLNWQSVCDEALRQALNNLDAVPTPAGEMPVVLGPGWPGVLLHEAIGHGLESDFNRKKVSAFSESIGKRVAASGITVVDDGTLSNRRGSISIDDEGVISRCTTLIEDGILVGYMHDCMNAKLMNTSSTGNGRRESYESLVMPRMTNTYMLAGNYDPNEIISSINKGLYAVNFGGGQVDITSGKFVFSASESYLIEGGKITTPVKGATLIGNGPDILTKVSMVGNDMALDPGVGTCSKNGQDVPVGVGQPTLKIDSITVGGTET